MKQLFTSQIIDAAEVNQRWLEKSGHLLENVDQTHLVLASGKPELQKRCCLYKGSSYELYYSKCNLVFALCQAVSIK